MVGVPAMVRMGDWMDVTAASLVDLASVGSVLGRHIPVVWRESSVVSSVRP